MKNNMIKVWGIKQMIVGGISYNYYWFDNKESRDEFYNTHDYCEKIRCRMMDKIEYAEQNH